MSLSLLVDKSFGFLRPIKINSLKRLGNKNDGGYVISEEILKKSDVLLSFGYGYDPSFEYDFLKRTGGKKKVFVFDYSCSIFFLIKKVLQYLKRLILFRKKIIDLKFHLKNLKNHLIFLKNKNIFFFKKKIVSNNKKNLNVTINTHSSGEIPILIKKITIDEIFKQHNLKNILFKCDIEGTEYLIIDDLIKYFYYINLMVIEFHYVDKNLKVFKRCIKTILKKFFIAHIHGNNNGKLVKFLNIPIYPEITFVNKRFLKKKETCKKNYPIYSLDNRNNTLRRDLFFHFR